MKLCCPHVVKTSFGFYGRKLIIDLCLPVLIKVSRIKVDSCLGNSWKQGSTSQVIKWKLHHLHEGFSSHRPSRGRDAFGRNQLLDRTLTFNDSINPRLLCLKGTYLNQALQNHVYRNQQSPHFSGWKQNNNHAVIQSTKLLFLGGGVPPCDPADGAARRLIEDLSSCLQSFRSLWTPPGDPGKGINPAVLLQRTKCC